MLVNDWKVLLGSDTLCPVCVRGEDPNVGSILLYLQHNPSGFGKWNIKKVKTFDDGVQEGGVSVDLERIMILSSKQTVTTLTLDL